VIWAATDLPKIFLVVLAASETNLTRIGSYWLDGNGSNPK
jgi:uncharacterized membrane protein